MSRPTYVTDEHVAEMNDITERVAGHLGFYIDTYLNPMSVCTHLMSTPHYRYVVKAIKRNCQPTAHFLLSKGFAISTSKVDRLIEMAAGNLANAVLLIKFGDGHIYYINLSLTPPDSVAAGGRTDRGDPNDIETENYYMMNKVDFII
jgi:hypothetical protein